jgi:hypothetical protein
MTKTLISNGRISFSSLFFLISILLGRCTGPEIDEGRFKSVPVLRAVDSYLESRCIALNVMNRYNVELDLELRKQNLQYALADTLMFALSKLNPNSLLNDTLFLRNSGLLLERLYLERRRIIDDPESLNAYNVAIWTIDRSCLRYILNIQRNQRFENPRSTLNYSSIIKDFVCIDSIVLRLDSFGLKNAIHGECMSLLEQKKTGSCIW